MASRFSRATVPMVSPVELACIVRMLFPVTMSTTMNVALGMSVPEGTNDYAVDFARSVLRKDSGDGKQAGENEGNAGKSRAVSSMKANPRREKWRWKSTYVRRRTTLEKSRRTVCGQRLDA